MTAKTTSPKVKKTASLDLVAQTEASLIMGFLLFFGGLFAAISLFANGFTDASITAGILSAFGGLMLGSAVLVMHLFD